MTYLTVGLVLLATMFAGLRLSLPGRDGLARPFITKYGLDGYIAIALTLGSAIGVVTVIYGAIELAANRD